nr:VP6 [Sathuvachari virus]
MTRLTLLAPGDVIRKAEQELKARRIDVLIQNDAEEGGKEQERKEEDEAGGKRVQESTNERKETGNATERGGEGTQKNDEDGGERQGREAEEVQIHKAFSENKGAGDRDDEVQATKQEKEDMVVLDSEVQKVIDKLYGIRLQTIDTITEIGDRVILKLGSNVLKQIGIGKEKVQEQNDALTRFKKTKTKKGRVMEVQFIESLKGLEAEIGVDKNREVDTRVSQSGVVLVTNDRRYVSQAHVIFTCPTGDTTWKETARQATKRSDIRAYVHDPANGDSEKGLLALVDLL